MGKDITKEVTCDGVHKFSAPENQIACQDVHFTSIEDIYLKSSIPGQSSILRVSGRSKRNNPLPVFQNEPQGEITSIPNLQSEMTLRVNDYW